MDKPAVNTFSDANDGDFDALKLSRQLCFPLYAASREVVKKYRPCLDPLGLTYTQYIALLVIWEARQLTSKALGEALLLDSGTLSPVLKKLEEKGLITRRRLPDDERNLLIDLTERGEEMKKQAAHIPSMLGACLPLTNEEALQLYSLLYKLINALK